MIPDQWLTQLERDEGYTRYLDYSPEGVQVIGYGTRLDVGLSQPEAKAVFDVRSRSVWEELIRKRPDIFLAPVGIQAGLFNIAHAITPQELIRRRRIWVLIKQREFHKIPNDVKNMPVAKAQPERVLRIANSMKTAVGRIHANWPLLQQAMVRRVAFQKLPWPFKIHLGLLCELPVDTIMDQATLFSCFRKKAWHDAAVEMGKLPFFQHDPRLSSRIIAALERPVDQVYLNWFDAPKASPALQTLHAGPLTY